MLNRLPRRPARPLRRLRRRRQRLARRSRGDPRCSRSSSRAAARAGAVDGARLGRDRRPARAHDPVRRRPRARQLAALRKLGAKRFDALMPLRRAARSRPSRPPTGRFPSTPGRSRKDERHGFKRSIRFLRGLRPPKAAASPPRRARARRLERLGRARQRPLVAVHRPAARLPDPRAARRVRGPPARARRPRRDAARPAGGRHRAQRPHRVGPHQRQLGRRRPVRGAPRRERALPLQGPRAQDGLPHRDLQGRRQEGGQAAASAARCTAPSRRARASAPHSRATTRSGTTRSTRSPGLRPQRGRLRRATPTARPPR